jgi:methionine biosynthesis protein MetW
VRESALKRVLVSAWFSGLEVRRGVSQAFHAANFTGTAIDYERYWRERAAGAVQPRFEIIAAGVSSRESLLDVGCGDGALLAYLRDRRGVQGIGLDVSQEAVSRARARGVDASHGTLSTLGNDTGGIFDHVVMSEVVEHVADAETLVRDGWARARRSLWLTFPNIAYFPHRLRLACGRFPMQWVRFPGEHLRFWSVPDFREWLEGLGLPPAAMVPSNGLTLARLHRVWPNLFANQVVVRIDRV